MTRILLLLAMLLSTPALAIIQTRAILVLGVEEPRPRAPDAVRAAGLAAFTTPSTTWTGDRRAPRHVIGRVLGAMVIDREGPDQVSAPVPSADEVARVKAALARLGLGGEPRVIAIVQESGGR